MKGSVIGKKLFGFWCGGNIPQPLPEQKNAVDITGKWVVVHIGGALCN